MKSSIVAKLEALYERHEEVQALLGDAATIADQDKFRALSREYAQLSDVARCYPDDERNAFVEVRAGTGGDEAALFAGDLFRMYSRYAESRRWQVEILSANEGEHGGF